MSKITCVYSPYFLLKSYNTKTKSVKPKTNNLSNNYEFKLNKKISGISIDSDSGVIYFNNYIEIGKYKILISLTDKEKKRKLYLKYYLVVIGDKEEKIFRTSEQTDDSIISNDKFYYNPYFLIKTINQQVKSSIPVIKLKEQYNYEFKFENSEKGVFINPNNGQITFSDTILVGKYIFNILLLKNNLELIKTQYYLIVIDDDNFIEHKKPKNNNETDLLSTDYYNIDAYNSGELSSQEFDDKLKLVDLNDDIKINNYQKIGINFIIDYSFIVDKIINNIGGIFYSDKISFLIKKLFNCFNISSDKYNTDDLTIFILSIVLILIYKKNFS